MSQGALLTSYGSRCVRWGAHVRVQCAAAEWLTARCTRVGEAGRVMRSARCIHPLQLTCATRPDNAKGASQVLGDCEGLLSFQMQWQLAPRWGKLALTTAALCQVAPNLCGRVR